MIPREQFLLALFRVLDQKAVPYCVLRNYANIYKDTSSDVDVVVESEHVPRFKICLAEAAVATNHQFVLRSRYTNYSYVYWHAEAGFIRVDIETEVRWHVFPVLTAKAIVGLRRKEGAYYIPHPRHESAILWVAAVWRGRLSKRYRDQLARLYKQVDNPRELERTFNASFGAIGQDLAARQSRITSQTFDRLFWKAARRSIVRNAFRDRPWRHEMLSYFTWDLNRLWDRMRRPRGISILYVTSARPGQDLKAFFQQMKFLYPIEKSDIHPFPRPSTIGKPFRHLGFRLRARRLFVLFKGGLFMRIYQLSHDSEIPRVLQTHTRYLFPSRTFIWAEDSQYHTCLAHVETGFMAERDSLTSVPVSIDRIAEFIAGVLQHYPPRGERRPLRPGACIALAGLDASGRSAVARSLSSLALAEKRFYRVRYFPWPIHLRRKTLFPLQALGHLPDGPPPGDEPLASRWPIFRACKNLLLAALGYHLRLRPLLHVNSLVLLDGYDCNRLSVPGAVANRGLAWPVAWFSSLYPRPDLLVVLSPPTAEIRSPEPAPSHEHLPRETVLAEQLEFDPQRTLQVDGSRPPLEIARLILQRIAAIVP